jgi:hypothetical protein
MEEDFTDEGNQRINKRFILRNFNATGASINMSTSSLQDFPFVVYYSTKSVTKMGC